MCLAVPGRIVEIQGEGQLRTGRVDFGGISREASLALLPEAHVGDFVLIHVGFAIVIVDEDEARATLAALAQLGEPTLPEIDDATRR
jgi:hydrogenase expression/formation protein HypC